MKWDVRMEGGPFDGDQARLDARLYDPEQVPKMWVRPCMNCGGKCGDTSWASEWVNGAEVYKRDEFDREVHMVKYVHEGLDTGPSLKEEASRELVLAGSA